MRGDGLIFATAGWDARVRVYSGRTMRELAVLKWHRESCYATAFAEVAGAEAATPAGDGSRDVEEEEEEVRTGTGTGTGTTTTTTARSQALTRAGEASKPSTAATTHGAARMTVSQRRERKAQTTHWIAAGSKDGKVSLWDIY